MALRFQNARYRFQWGDAKRIFLDVTSITWMMPKSPPYFSCFYNAVVHAKSASGAVIDGVIPGRGSDQISCLEEAETSERF